jgi:hypothetical protein
MTKNKKMNKKYILWLTFTVEAAQQYNQQTQEQSTAKDHSKRLLEDLVTLLLGAISESSIRSIRSTSEARTT